jgi:chemotaxis protein MotB
MGRNPFEEDSDVQAMRASMRPGGAAVRWARVLTGVLVVACITFALAYYVPLRSAHQTLLTRFTEVQSKVDAANRSAEESRARVKELDDKNQTLQSQLDGVQQREKASAEASRAVKSALESKLQKPISGEQAAVGLAGNQALVSLSLGFLLTRGKLELSPPGKAALCSVASASKDHALRVSVIAGKKDIPAALAPRLKTPLEYNLAVAELVTRTLVEHCKAAANKLSASGVPAEPASAAKLDGKKLSGARVDLWLESAP